MQWKIIVVVIITAAIGVLTHSPWAATGAFVVALFVASVIEGVRVVPQQHAYVVERFGKFDKVLEPGLRLINPFFARVAYKHSLKELPLYVPEQV